jgi:hypothetical protein
MNRIDILNALIRRYNYKTFCEIGVQAGDCFRGIQCETKIGVDPDPASAATFHITSDAFFDTVMSYNIHDGQFVKDQKGTIVPKKFDIYWIDGDHTHPQVERDILNALKYLNEGGVVCAHDMEPNSKHCQQVPLTDQGEWCGDCWRSLLKIRLEHEDLEISTVSTDWGCALIRKGNQPKLKMGKAFEDVTYEDFVIHKREWLNLISVSEFRKRYLV